jgi:hypothetical protein
MRAIGGGADLGAATTRRRQWSMDRSDTVCGVSTALWLPWLDSELLFIGDAGNTEPSLASRRFGIEVPLSTGRTTC